MNMPSNIFPTSLKTFAGLACILASMSYAQSDSREVFSNSFNTPSSPNDVDFRKGFAKSIRKITEDGLVAEKISKKLDWRILEEKNFEEAKTTITIFDLYRKIGNPRLSHYATDKKMSLVVQLAPEYICLRSEDVLREFGSKFKPSTLIVESRGESSEIKMETSDVVGRNKNLFSFGPVYEIPANGKNYRIFFRFIESECVSSIHIHQQ